MNLAVIPARGGSKRISRKNVKLFFGKPMLAYAIEAAFACGEFEHVVVSTDDVEIADIARKYGAEVPFFRPDFLADDFTPTVPVIGHAIRCCLELGWSIEQVCCIYPCAPFVSTDDLRSGLTQLKSGAHKYVFPITAFPSPVQRALRRFTDGSIRPFQPEYAATRTQDLEAGFFDAGQFYWGRKDAWLEDQNIHMNGSTLIVPEWRVVDIDTIDDWERAESMYELLASKKAL